MKSKEVSSDRFPSAAVAVVICDEVAGRAEPQPVAPFIVWTGPRGGFNVSGANQEYVCETGHGDMAMKLAYRIADLLNAHGVAS